MSRISVKTQVTEAQTPSRFCRSTVYSRKTDWSGKRPLCYSLDKVTLQNLMTTDDAIPVKVSSIQDRIEPRS